MRQWLVGAILFVAVIGLSLTQILLGRMSTPGEAVSSLLIGALWVALPYLVAAGLAWLLRQYTAVLIVLLCSLLVAGALGISELGEAALHVERAEEERKAWDAARKGVIDIGPGLGVAFARAHAIGLAIYMIPLQLAAILTPTVLVYAVVLNRRYREALAAGSGPDRRAGG